MDCRIQWLYRNNKDKIEEQVNTEIVNGILINAKADSRIFRNCKAINR